MVICVYMVDLMKYIKKNDILFVNYNLIHLETTITIFN
jgi:hypothetical protein